MTTPRRPLAALAALVALAAGGVLAGCAGPSGITASGRVEDRTDVVSAPALLAPAADPEAGLTPTADPARTAAPTAPANVAAVRVTDAVGLGTRVRAGDPVAHLDTSVQDAALGVARADAVLAERRVTLLESRTTDVRDKRADLRERRRAVREGIDQLTAKRAELRTTRTDLRAKRSDLDARLPGLAARRDEVAQGVAALVEQRRRLAGTPPSPQRDAALAALDARLAEARAGLGKLDAALAKARAGRSELTRGLRRVDAGLRSIATNLTKARDGLRTIDDGLAELADAESQLVDATELARITTTTSAVAVARADQQRALTTLVAPADGVVVRTAQPGDVLAPGAPVLEILPLGHRVTTWLAPDAAASVCAGTPATVTTDWGTSHPATVTTLGTRADYPPTAQATDDVHLTRAVSVTVTLTDALPPGAPVDLTFTPCAEED